MVNRWSEASNATAAAANPFSSNFERERASNSPCSLTSLKHTISQENLMGVKEDHSFPIFVPMVGLPHYHLLEALALPVGLSCSYTSHTFPDPQDIHVAPLNCVSRSRMGLRNSPKTVYVHCTAEGIR